MALKKFAFKVLNKDKYARRGVIQTHRGNITYTSFYASWNSSYC